MASALGEGFADGLDVGGFCRPWIAPTTARNHRLEMVRLTSSTACRAGGARLRSAWRDRLEINEDEQPLAAWAYADIRRADSPPSMLRVSCATAPALARLEVRDTVLAGQLVSRCAGMDDDIPGRRGVAAIIGWSLAATVSIIAVVLFGLPLAADRLAPLVPAAFERRPERCRRRPDQETVRRQGLRQCGRREKPSSSS